MNMHTMIAPVSTAGAVAPDAVIEAAFQRRQSAYTSYNDLQQAGGPPDSTRDRELWTAIDEAECRIQSTVAQTPRGAMIQLWCAMYHSVTGGVDDDALTRGDFAALERLDSSLDWDGRMMLAALRSLQAMEAN